MESIKNEMDEVIDRVIMSIRVWNKKAYNSNGLNIEPLIIKIDSLKLSTDYNSINSKYMNFLHLLVERMPKELGEYISEDLKKLEEKLGCLN